MPIKNFVSGDISYLVKYEPYELTANVIEPIDISEMVSIDLQPSTTLVEYDIGAEGSYEGEINIKNLTNNAVLNVRILVPLNLFIIDQETSTSPQNTGQIIERSIDPLQQIKIAFKLNKEYLNSGSVGQFETSMPITIQYNKSTSIITKNINVTSLPTVNLPDKIKVV
jgi:hypothetical protein